MSEPIVSAKSVANYFLALAEKDGELLDPMKLQKLVYYAHGWYAGYTGTPLIDESIEAWPYGPVIPGLYHEFKQYGSRPIRRKACDWDGTGMREVEAPSNSSVRKFLGTVWRSYGRFSALELSEKTHAVGSPWHKARQMNPGVRGADIPFELIVSHFKAAVDRIKSKEQG